MWRDPGRPMTARTAVSGIRHESSFSARMPDTAACALEERRPRHPSSPFNSREGTTRQNRRTPGTSAGEKTDNDGFLHSESSVFSPATGDLHIACRSAESPRFHDTITATAPWCLGGCDVGGWVDLRYLRDLRANWAGGGSVSSLCPLCLCGSSAVLAGDEPLDQRLCRTVVV